MQHLKLCYRVCSRAHQSVLKGSPLPAFPDLQGGLHVHKDPQKGTKSNLGGAKGRKMQSYQRFFRVLISWLLQALCSISLALSLSCGLGLWAFISFVSWWVSNLYLHFNPLSKALMSHFPLPVGCSILDDPHHLNLIVSQTTISFFSWLPYFKESQRMSAVERILFEIESSPSGFVKWRPLSL